MQNIIADSPSKMVSMVVQRDGKKIKIPLKPEEVDGFSRLGEAKKIKRWSKTKEIKNVKKVEMQSLKKTEKHKIER